MFVQWPQTYESTSTRRLCGRRSCPKQLNFRSSSKSQSTEPSSQPRLSQFYREKAGVTIGVAQATTRQCGPAPLRRSPEYSRLREVRGPVDHEGCIGHSLFVTQTSVSLSSSDKSTAVWRHTVLPFGAAGSVWAYLRVADVIWFLGIALFWLRFSHFVDDSYMCEPSHVRRTRSRVFQGSQFAWI